MFSSSRTRFFRALPGLLAGIALTASASISAHAAPAAATARPIPLAGADELTPSRSEYFSWINNAWEGSDAAQTRVNLDFFRWLHDTYGMKLDIYALDAGNLDTNGRRYGNTTSPGFLQKYPQGFGPLAKQAAAMGTRLGMWAGPDGFGNTPAEAAARAETVTALFRDHNFALLKLDGACGTLRREKWTEFDNMMTEIRRHVPDAILLNHRLKLGPGTRHATTFLLGGDETYIDVHMTNKTTGPHHRVAAISRELPPRLTRLTEDHGVCLSSCLDYWEDDLILQAFNRNLILAPEIYGNPWFLRDTEYPRLAYIFNLHRHYRDILVHGQTLPAEKYGPNAVTRGDTTTRFVTLRNLTWEPAIRTITLDKEIGLEKPIAANAQVRVRLYHPAYRDLGVHPYGAQIPIETAPFRSLLFKAVVEPALTPDTFWADTAAPAAAPTRAASEPIVPVGIATSLTPAASYHRRVATPEPAAIPADAEALYEATCYAADNNALEVRALQRSGPTAIPQVQRARDAFFNNPFFLAKGAWDKYLFDGDPATVFTVTRMMKSNPGSRVLHLDLGALTRLDKLVLTAPATPVAAAQLTDSWGVPINAPKPEKAPADGTPLTAQISADLRTWTPIVFAAGPAATLDLRGAPAFRYLRLTPGPASLAEITGYRDGVAVDRSQWRASNLFLPFRPVKKAWRADFVIEKFRSGSWLCVALEGNCGQEDTYVAFKVDGQYVGCPDRAPSFASNVWEYPVRRSGKNYTYYLPLTPDMAGKKIEAHILGFVEQVDIRPVIWQTAKVD